MNKLLACLKWPLTYTSVFELRSYAELEKLAESWTVGIPSSYCRMSPDMDRNQETIFPLQCLVTYSPYTQT